MQIDGAIYMIEYLNGKQLVSCNVNDYKTRMILQNVQIVVIVLDFHFGWWFIVQHKDNEMIK